MGSVPRVHGREHNLPSRSTQLQEQVVLTTYRHDCATAPNVQRGIAHLLYARQPIHSRIPHQHRVQDLQDIAEHLLGRRVRPVHAAEHDAGRSEVAGAEGECDLSVGRHAKPAGESGLESYYIEHV